MPRRRRVRALASCLFASAVAFAAVGTAAPNAFEDGWRQWLSFWWPAVETARDGDNATQRDADARFAIARIVGTGRIATGHSSPGKPATSPQPEATAAVAIAPNVPPMPDESRFKFRMPRACAPFPRFPDLDCVGVPPGYPLADVAALSTTRAGEHIDGKRIFGDLDIEHDDVLVTNTRIHGRIHLRGHAGLRLQDVDLGADACPDANNGGFRLIDGGGGYSLLRSYLHHNGDDVLVAGGGAPVLVEDSVIKHTCFYPEDHLDALQFYDPGGVGDVTIAHSVIDVRPDNADGHGNAAIFWADRPGRGSTLTIFESLLAGGGYTLAAYDSGLNSGVTIDVARTRFVRGSFQYAACGLGSQVDPANHSPTIPFNGVEGIRWTDNAYDDGTPLARCE